MDLGYRVITASEQRTSVWSGGTTTELAIFPPGASYPARDFAWRLSTATVTAGESTFTALPGYHRLLMVLAGEMRLSHAGQHQCTLGRFEQDSFSGGWQTACVGTGRDFNLMLAEGWRGSLVAISVPADGTVALDAASPVDPANPADAANPAATEALYCVIGRARFRLPDGGEVSVGTGDFLLLEPSAAAARGLTIATDGGPAELVHARVRQP